MPRKAAPEARRRPGEGSIKQHAASGLWRVRIELRPDPVTGERRRKEFSRARKSDALVEMRRIQAEVREHGDIAVSTSTVRAWLTHWHAEIDRSKPKTRSVMAGHITNYLVPLIGKVRLAELGDRDIRKVAKAIAAKGLSSTYALTVLKTLASALDAAIQAKQVRTNIVKTSVYRPKASTPKRELLTQPEAILVLAAAHGTRLELRWQLALKLGSRQGETLGIELEQVDLKRGHIAVDWQLQTIGYVHGCARLATGWECASTNGMRLPNGTLERGGSKPMSCPSRFLDYDPGSHEVRKLHGSQYLTRPKTRRSTRKLPLAGDALALSEQRLAAAASEPNPYGLLFTAPPKRRWYAGTKTVIELPLGGLSIDSSSDSKAWHALQATAGVAKPVGIHGARRTAITGLYELGVSEAVIIDIVGRVDAATSRLYRQASLDGARAALEQVDDRLR